MDQFEERLVQLRDGTVAVTSHRVAAVDGTGDSAAGLCATATGQHGGWMMLPHDQFGAVLDEADATTRILSLLRILTSQDIERPTQIAIAAGIEPADCLPLGGAADVGRRASATSTRCSDRPVRWLPRECARFDAIVASPAAAAQEIATRLTIACREQNS